MSNINDLIVDDLLGLIIYKSNNCMCRFVCKRWEKVYPNFKNYSPQKNDIKIFDSIGGIYETFSSDKLVITDINKRVGSEYNNTFYNKLVAYDGKPFTFQTPFFKITKNYVFDTEWADDLSGIFEFTLDNDCHGCHNLKHFFDTIDKKIENDKETIFVKINNIVNKNNKIDLGGRILVYDNIVKKNSSGNYCWRPYVDASNIIVWKRNENCDLVRISVNDDELDYLELDYLDNIIYYIPIGSYIKLRIRIDSFSTDVGVGYLRRPEPLNTVYYGVKLYVTEIEFIPNK